MDYITIGGQTVPYPNDFQLQKVPNIVAEYTTMSGDTVADVNGWKYGDTTLNWDTLLESDLQNLLEGISERVFEIEFVDIDGNLKQVNAILKERVNTKTRMRYNGQIVWRNIGVSVSFPDCYHDTEPNAEVGA